LRLKRIRDGGTARRVARGVRHYNGVHLSTRRVLARPHYAIMQLGRLAGWIGIERRSRGACEVCHLSVLPRYRRRGLAEAATRKAMGLVRSCGAHYAYARIVRSNRASIGLFRKLGFRRSSGGRGRVRVYGRPA